MFLRERNEYFEREKWERKNRIVRKVSDRGEKLKGGEKLSQGESQTQKWKSKIASCFYFSSYT